MHCLASDQNNDLSKSMNRISNNRRETGRVETISLCDTCTYMRSWAKKKPIVSIGQRKNTLIDNQDSVGQGLFVLVKFLLE